MNSPNTEKRDVRSVYADGGAEALRNARTEAWTPKFTSHTTTGNFEQAGTTADYVPEDEPPFSHSTKKKVKPFFKYLNNDLGNSELFVARRGDQARYSPGIGWLFWSGVIWRPDNLGGVTDIAAKLTHETLKEAAEIEDKDKRDAAVRRALRLGDKKVIASMLDLAKGHAAICTEPSQLNNDPLLIGCQNAVISLTNGQHHKPNPDDLITRSLGVAHNPAATCPRWERFISEIMLGDKEMIEFLHRAVGYTLTGEVKEQVFFFLHGNGSNGKSVLVETIRLLLGDYAAKASRSLLESANPAQQSENKSDLARLPGVRLLCASETRQRGSFNEDLLKDVTGGEVVNARALYQMPFDFVPCFKIWISGNYRPRIEGTDGGIWRRVRLIPFEATFTDENKDPDLAETLKAELPGILNWAVAGAVKWCRDGLSLPEKVRLAVNEYRDDQDVLGDFLKERIQESPGTPIKKATVYAAYRDWCQDNGYKHQLSSHALSRNMKQRGMDDGGSHYWRGVRLVESDPFTEETRR